MKKTNRKTRPKFMNEQRKKEVIRKWYSDMGKKGQNLLTEIERKAKAKKAIMARWEKYYKDKHKAGKYSNKITKC